jgi:hypothetical protein
VFRFGFSFAFLAIESSANGYPSKSANNPLISCSDG